MQGDTHAHAHTRARKMGARREHPLVKARAACRSILPRPQLGGAAQRRTRSATAGTLCAVLSSSLFSISIIVITVIKVIIVITVTIVITLVIRRHAGTLEAAHAGARISGSNRNPRTPSKGVHHCPPKGGSEKGDPTITSSKSHFKIICKSLEIVVLRIPLFGSPFGGGTLDFKNTFFKFTLYHGPLISSRLPLRCPPAGERTQPPAAAHFSGPEMGKPK